MSPGYREASGVEPPKYKEVAGVESPKYKEAPGIEQVITFAESLAISVSCAKYDKLE